jgi:hypothetical protein
MASATTMPTAMIAAFIGQSAKHNCPSSNYNTAMLTHNPLTYEVMRIWDEDRSEWSAEQRDFAAAWRQPKWVVSRSLKSVGPNATLVEDD